MSRDLGPLRERIDALDRTLVETLLERAEVARAIGLLKDTSGTLPMDPGRERRVLERVLDLNAGRYPPEVLVGIFREIISASRAMEGEITVGVLGRAGAFADQAARRRFGSAAGLHAYGDAERLLDDLEHGRVQYAVVARDIGDEDPALDHFDPFLHRQVTLFGETVFRGGYAAVGVAGDDPALGPDTILGSPSALARCRRYLQRHPGADVVATADSAEAAHRLGSGRIALIPAGLARPGEQGIIEACAEDDPDPQRRFLLLSTHPPARSGRDRTALVCVLTNRSGALAGLVGAFASAGVNVDWIEIRASRRRTWEHTFFVEVSGHIEDEAVEAAVAAARTGASHLQVLGSYPIED